MCGLFTFKMMVHSVFATFISLILTASVHCAGHKNQNVIEGSVYCTNRTCTFKPGLDKEGATAYASYTDGLMTTGWDILDIKSGYGAHASNDDIMFAAGFIEATLTTERIYQNFLNINFTFFRSVTPALLDKVKIFMKKQDSWMRVMCNNDKEDPFWRHVCYIAAQFDGLFVGYRKNMQLNQTLVEFDLQVLNGVGDLIDLVSALDPASVPDWSKMTKDEIMQTLGMRGHCSALVKLLPGYENVFMSHSSWFTYSATMRIYKHYDLNVKDEYTAAKKISFSSYPGFLESLDDFYHLGSGMVMLQTTNNIFNKTLYKLVKPDSLLAWQRIRVANMLARSGEEWGKFVASYNSGTYNNQYMVIDLKKIDLKKGVRDGAFYVVEQIPGLVEYSDQTHILREGYWPSYNIPFFETIYNRSGYPEFVAKHGSDFSYQLAPRAKIFRRDQGGVYDMETMKHIMRYNDYPSDPYSEAQPCNTICCRGDLKTTHPDAGGCYDTKVSDYNMALKFQADIINGPTIGEGLPYFSWKAFPNTSHVGLPEIYKFSFIQTQPKFD